ncbi:mavicyanin-like [Papaver somniferum]|uniref:mavicyanin-like n=1 Tax=Papaver somniferum TaxID=3469 RepID=UPI000E701918|nr:mavicyanin-like [Papaver somniferum]
MTDTLNNVVEVDFTNFRSCNASSPMDLYTMSGNVIIPLTAAGHFFFISTDHCSCGQKVDIRILSGPSPKSPTTTKPRQEEEHGNENENNAAVKAASFFITTFSIFLSVIVGSGANVGTV